MEIMDDASTVERMLMSEASEKCVPINGSIELLPLCNMNCDMCYVRLSKSEMESQGRLRSVDEWIEIGKQMQDAGILFLLLTGGEPLLYPEFKRLFIELKKMGMILTINTNGTLIDEDWALFFSKYKPRRVNITLYGSSEKTYDSLCHYADGFNRAIKGIKLLKKYDIDVKVACSVTKANLGDLEDIIALEDILDVPVRCDTYMLPATRERKKPYCMQSRLDPKSAAKARIIALKKEMGKDLFNKLIEKTLYEKENFSSCDDVHYMSCHAGKCSFTINWQGEMRPCVIMTHPAISVFDVGFLNAWKHIVEQTHKIILSSKCQKCSLKSLCRTCAASALLEEGSYETTPKYMCEYTEYSYQYLLEEYKQGEKNGN